MDKKEKIISEKNQNKQAFVWGWVLVMATLAAFYPSLWNGFINWDDQDHVTSNPMIQSLDFAHLKEILITPILKTYVPLSILSFAVEYRFFKLNPFFYHLDNLLLHLIVVFLVFRFLKKLGLSLRAAGLAALLFAVHPIHAESVAWVTERKDVLCATFYLLALINYGSYLEERKKSAYVMSIFCGLLSMLAKTMALSLPFILLLYDGLYRRKDTGKMLLEKLPYLVYILPMVWITYTANTSVMKAETNFVYAVLIFIWTLTFYIKQFLFPWPLSALYQTPEPISIFNGHYILAVMILIVCAVIFMRYHSNRWIIFAFLFYFFSIFFLLRFERLYNLSVVADRFMYLPCLGFCLLTGYYGDKLWQKVDVHKGRFKPVFIILLCFIFGLLVIKTNLQCRIWKDSISFWTSVIKTSPNLSVAYTNRGIAYKDQAMISSALQDYTKAIQINKDAYETYFNRGNAYYALQQYDLAVDDYTAAIKIKADYPMAYNNRGSVYSTLKNYIKAVEDYSAAVRIDPTFADAYFNRGNAYYFLGKFDLAIESFSQAVRYKKDYWQAYINRAFLYGSQGQYDLALRDYSYLIENNADTADAYYERSRIYVHFKKFDQALADALKAKSLGYPGIEKYIVNLSQIMHQ